MIEADIALKITTPPGVRYPGFIGIAFRVRPDASHYELFYVRPGNSDSADQLQRNHSVQYTSEPTSAGIASAANGPPSTRPMSRWRSRRGRNSGSKWPAALQSST